jgi:hypothetical protein
MESVSSVSRGRTWPRSKLCISIDLLTFLLTNRLDTRLSYAVTRVRTSASIHNPECSIIDRSVESSTIVRVTVLVSY